MNKLPSLYASQSVKSKTDTAPFGGIKVKSNRNGKSVSHSPVGIIDPEFNNILIGYGWGWTANQLRDNTHFSGGHANLRAVVDSLQADFINRIHSKVRGLLHGQRVEVIDVGAKFMKIGRVLHQLFSPEPRDFAPLKKAEVLVA